MKILLFCLLLLATHAQAQSCRGTFPYYEGFEISLGVWTNDSGDDTDWIVNSGSTPSAGTGPASAYDGTDYLYVEATNFNNSTATLTSSCFDLRSIVNPELEFKYHMYGNHMGTLFLEYNTGLGGWSTIWARGTNQGNQWRSEIIDLGGLTNSSNVRFRFRAVTGNGYLSDIAIDAVRIRGDEPPMSPCTSSLPVANSFETGFDGWSQNYTDNADWTRRSGSTPTANTGPSSASDGNFYLYVESSSYSQSNNIAILDGPCRNVAGSINVSFAYHMWGADVSFLGLQVSENGGPWNYVWVRNGSQGSSWQTANITLGSYSSQTSVRFRFRADFSSGGQGDIAIDDFDVANSGGGIGGGCCGDPGDGGFGLTNPNGNNNSFQALDGAAELTVAPNPFQDQIVVRTTLPNVQGYRLTNLQGITIQEGLLQRPEISVKNLPTGIYFITVYNEKEELVQKIVKQ